MQHTTNPPATWRTVTPDAAALQMALRAVWGAMKPKARARALGVLDAISRDPAPDLSQPVVRLDDQRRVEADRARAAADPVVRAQQWRMGSQLRLIKEALSN